MSAVSSHGLGYCRVCGRQVRTTITAAGRRQAVDPEPDDAGNVVARLDHTGTWRSRVPTAALPQAPFEKRFMPHAATCGVTSRGPGREGRLPEGVVSLDDHRRRSGGSGTLFPL